MTLSIQHDIVVIVVTLAVVIVVSVQLFNRFLCGICFGILFTSFTFCCQHDFLS